MAPYFCVPAKYSTLAPDALAAMICESTVVSVTSKVCSLTISDVALSPRPALKPCAKSFPRSSFWYTIAILGVATVCRT